ncbi:hypothetical protein E2542_SST16909 [Spatholobus suberectus]|nr:hypothetical protein E2542_SST16909 [Spatholobus suberectus]
MRILSFSMTDFKFGWDLAINWYSNSMLLGPSVVSVLVIGRRKVDFLFRYCYSTDLGLECLYREDADLDPLDEYGLYSLA